MEIITLQESSYQKAVYPAPNFQTEFDKLELRLIQETRVKRDDGTWETVRHEQIGSVVIDDTITLDPSTLAISAEEGSVPAYSLILGATAQSVGLEPGGRLFDAIALMFGRYLIANGIVTPAA